jgi:amidase
VEILRIRLKGDSGIIVAVPGRGGFGGKITEFRAREIPLGGGVAHFDERIKVPINPMVGRIGTSPLGQPVPSGTPGPHGGNMDNNHITEGSTVYLPVYKEGALLALGDLHAAMGDGESVLSGVEAYGEVTLRCSAVDEPRVSRPLVATRQWVMTTAEGVTLEDAWRLALDDMAGLLSRRLGLDYIEAAMLISAAGELRICQIVNPKVGVKVMIPTTILTL